MLKILNCEVAIGDFLFNLNYFGKSKCFDELPGFALGIEVKILFHSP